MSLVRRQTGGVKAETGFDKYNVVINGVVYRARFFKVGVGFYKPTFVVSLEDTGSRQAEKPNRRPRS